LVEYPPGDCVDWSWKKPQILDGLESLEQRRRSENFLADNIKNTMAENACKSMMEFAKKPAGRRGRNEIRR
ncbi:hypothetical protein KCU59_g132, partial [Aureobasidium melanogenum]